MLHSKAMDEGKLGTGGYGAFQLLFLMACYGYILVNGANLIGDGAELLLLVPSMEGIVGTLVLPILGAVPDGAMVFFSGLGSTAQTQLSVGMGALAGSTIMLLTIPWFLSILAGRVDIEDGECVYKRKKGVAKLTPGRGMTQSGVSPDSAVPVSCRLMLATCISYIIIQAPAMSKPKFKPTPESNAAHIAIAHEEDFALVGLITTGTMFLIVCAYQVYAGGSEADVTDAKLNSVRKREVNAGHLNFRGCFYNQLHSMSTAPSPGGMHETLLAGDKDSADAKTIRNFLRGYYDKYDTDNNHQMDIRELKMLFRDLGARMLVNICVPHFTCKALLYRSNAGEIITDAKLREIVQKYDENNDGVINLDEFCALMVGLAHEDRVNKVQMGTMSRTVSMPTTSNETQAAQVTGSINASVDVGAAGHGNDDDDDLSDESEDEMPDDLADLDYDAQQRAIKIRASWQMALGTILVLLFSDPMVDCLAALGDRLDISSFYISFVLAPLASNASELLAAYRFALKKTKATITVSLSQLEGAAIMNNTFCLGVFMLLIYFRKLQWAYSAEVAAILFVQLAMAIFACKRVNTLLDGYMILALYPMSLVIVIVLENVFMLD